MITGEMIILVRVKYIAETLTDQEQFFENLSNQLRYTALQKPRQKRSNVKVLEASSEWGGKQRIQRA